VKPAAVALVVLMLLSVVGLYALASVAATPTRSTTTVTEIGVSNRANFTYAATLRPNLLYNTTEIGPGQGTLYTSLVTQLNVSYDYALVLSRTADVSLDAGFTLVLSAPGEWSYTLNQSLVALPANSDVVEVDHSAGVAINVTSTLRTLRTIENETSYSAETYWLNYTPILEATIVTAGGSGLQSLFEPTMSFALTTVQLFPGSLVDSSATGLNSTSTSDTPGRSGELLLAGAAFAALLAATGVAGFVTLRETQRNRSIRAQLREITAPFRDAIAVTGTPPKRQNNIVLADWHDLARVADMLAKPILRWEYTKTTPSRFLFYVLDGSTQYIYLVPREGRPDDEVLAQLQ
jgi:hypothetical protein